MASPATGCIFHSVAGCHAAQREHGTTVRASPWSTVPSHPLNTNSLPPPTQPPLRGPTPQSQLPAAAAMRCVPPQAAPLQRPPAYVLRHQAGNGSGPAAGAYAHTLPPRPWSHVSGSGVGREDGALSQLIHIQRIIGMGARKHYPCTTPDAWVQPDPPAHPVHQSPHHNLDLT